MDFFQHQEAARKRTGLLVVLLVMAVVAIIATVYIAVAAVLFGLGHAGREGLASLPLRLWDPSLFGLVAGGTVALVTGGSLYKIAALSGGGHTVAELLGGRLLSADSAGPAERRLLNVVEEMAIAAGTPVPPVYLLSDETAINAFAAGHSPTDAVIGVTRGCVDHLSRDELQGVIAHEFSHILNGDMRLNLRLMGILFGILLIGLTGWAILRSQMGFRARARDDDRKGANPLPLIGLALYVIGYVGVFFGNLIKAAVSRQREYLADASAVQFTRNPDGLAGALKKIGALSAGSRIQSPEAAEASHMFFGEAIGPFGTLLGLLSTHPPLTERIRRIDPSFDGDYSQVNLQPPPPAVETAPRGPRPSRRTGPLPINPAEAIRRVGTMNAAGLAYAAELAGSFPGRVDSLAREPYSARGVIFALLLDPNEDVRAAQLSYLAAHVEPTLHEEVLSIVPEIARLAPEERLPLVALTVPALRRLTRGQFHDFITVVKALVAADRRISLFEYALQKHLLAHLADFFGQTGPRPVRYAASAPLVGPATVVLSGLAYAGSRDGAAVTRAFEAATQALGWSPAPERPLAPEAVDLQAIDNALDALVKAAPALKKDVLRACAAAIGVDNQITVEEGELLRAVADSLDCPMPPLLGTAGPS